MSVGTGGLLLLLVGGRLAGEDLDGGETLDTVLSAERLVLFRVAVDRTELDKSLEVCCGLLVIRLETLAVSTPRGCVFFVVSERALSRCIFHTVELNDPEVRTVKDLVLEVVWCLSRIEASVSHAKKKKILRNTKGKRTRVTTALFFS